MSKKQITSIYHAPNILWHYRVPTYIELASRFERLDVAYVELEKGIVLSREFDWNIGECGGLKILDYLIFLNFATLKALRSDCECLLFEWNVRNLALIPTSLIARFIQKKKVIWWGHGQSKTPSFFTKLTLITGKYIPNSVVVYMDSTKDKLVKSNGFNLDKTFVARNGIDIQGILNAVDKYDKKEDTIWFTAYSGRLNEGRDLDRIVHSISELRKKGYICKHFFIGDGPEKESLQELSCKLGVEDNIVFCGSIHDIEKLAKIYSLVDFVIVPGWLGLVIHQAFAFAKPVIVCDNKALHNPEIALFDESKGWFYSYKNNELTKVIEEVIATGKKEVRKMGVSCQKLIIDRYSTEIMVDGIEEAVHSA